MVFLNTIKSKIKKQNKNMMYNKNKYRSFNKQLPDLSLLLKIILTKLNGKLMSYQQIRTLI